MSHYIVCQRKRNTPRMDVRICEKKCPIKEDCREYIAYHKIVTNDKPVVLKPEPLPMEMGAA